METRIIRLLTLLGFTFFILSIVGGGLQGAYAASCHCNVKCTGASAGTFLDNQVSWGGYSGLFPQWNQCKAQCQTYLNSLNLEEIAKSKNVCGTISCASSYKIGTHQWREGDTRVTQVNCDGSDGEHDYQYAAKLVCGPGDGQIATAADYATTVNIHNPDTSPTAFRTKVALSGNAVDGNISMYTESELGPDGAQYFECANMRSRFDPMVTGLIDGFFVIESRKPLDIIALYTDNRNVAPAQIASPLQIKRIAERKIEKREWCGGQTNFPIDLATAPWKVVKPDTSSATPVTTNSPAWAGGSSRTWLTPPPLDSNQKPTELAGGEYVYRFEFCACNPGGRVVGDARADNTLDGGPTKSALVTPGTSVRLPLFATANAFQLTDSFLSSKPPVPFDVLFPGIGTGHLEISVWNAGHITGLSPSGTLTLNKGRLGPCP